mmetsp:Transcript_31256/g.93233  ORF Transcript_31256/g.93233 Transcript_31256/m.93233 type:complete len:242 (-) Transcript_31256:2-727(-)
MLRSLGARLTLVQLLGDPLAVRLVDDPLHRQRDRFRLALVWIKGVRMEQLTKVIALVQRLGAHCSAHVPPVVPPVERRQRRRDSLTVRADVLTRVLRTGMRLPTRTLDLLHLRGDVVVLLRVHHTLPAVARLDRGALQRGRHTRVRRSCFDRCLPLRLLRLRSAVPIIWVLCLGDSRSGGRSGGSGGRLCHCRVGVQWLGCIERQRCVERQRGRTRSRRSAHRDGSSGLAGHVCGSGTVTN